MGQKVNPISLRLGINRTWDSRWYAKKEYATLLHQDLWVRDYVSKALAKAGIARVVIERPAKKAIVSIYAARPGLIIGKRGSDIDGLRKALAKRVKADLSLNILEVRKAEIESKLVAEGIAQQLERRVSFRRAMKRAMQTAMKMGALGIRINCSGRLGGAEIARTEWYLEGKVPLHTLRAEIDYGVATAFTAYGTCGIKVWIYKGDVAEHDPMAQEKRGRKQTLAR
jgi:small subunit ribosomal protein S3